MIALAAVLCALGAFRLGLGLGLTRRRHRDTAPVVVTSYLLQEDGASRLTLEDGSGFLEQE